MVDFIQAGRDPFGAFQQGRLNRQRLDQGKIQQQVLQNQLAEQERVRKQGISQQQQRQSIIDLLPPVAQPTGQIGAALGQQPDAAAQPQRGVFGIQPLPEAQRNVIKM